MKHLMIDLETLDTSDTAVVIQVGMVVFDDDGNLLGEICVNINAIDSLLNGFTTSVDTCKNFWAKQDRAVKESVLYPKEQYSCRESARLIDRFIKDQFGTEKFIIWSNHLLFDIPKTNLLLTKCGFKSLSDRTPHYLVENFASVKNTAKRLYPDEFEAAKKLLSNEMAHNAVADCYYQIALLHSCYDILGNRVQVPEVLKHSPPAEVERPVEDIDPLLNPPEMLDDLASWEDDDEVNQSDPFLTEVYNPTKAK